MQILNVLSLLLLLSFQIRGWKHECCKCEGDDGDDFMTFTGGVNYDDEGNEIFEDDSEVKAPVKRAALSSEKQELLDLHNKYRRQIAEGRVPGHPGSNKIGDLVGSFLL